MRHALPTERSNAARLRAGMTLLELMVVVAIIGIVTALAVPDFRQMRDHARLRDVARESANVLQLARQRAISTGNNHVVYFSSGGATDRCGNPFPNDPTTGGPVPIILFDDGPPGPGTNCCLDPVETLIETVAPQANVAWGVRAAAPPVPQVPQDVGAGDHNTGSSFADPAGNQAAWVLFRPDGMPVGFNVACGQGTVGSGGGAIYVNNGVRDLGVVLSPLGSVKVFGFDRSQGAAGAWTN